MTPAHNEYDAAIEAARTVLRNSRGVGPVGNCEVDVWDLDALGAALVALDNDSCPRGGTTAEDIVREAIDLWRLRYDPVADGPSMPDAIVNALRGAGLLLIDGEPLHCTAYAEDGGCGREDCPRCGRPLLIDGSM